MELATFTTTGDRWSASGAATPADKGMFVKELEQALLDGRADLAVHSAKDLPTELPEGLAVLAVPARADARDVLVGVPGGADALTPGMRIGTGSPRREAQLRSAFPGVEVIAVRGNVGTRLGRLDEADVDGVVLAAAGLARLGLSPDDAHALAPDVCTPAAGQGALALEGRAGDARVAGIVAVLADHEATGCLAAERAVLEGLGGGCMAPVGAYCVPVDGGVRMLAFVAVDASGAGAQRADVTAPTPAQAAALIVEQLGGAG